MLGLATTRIRPLTEDSCNEIVELAGGRRAHPDHDRRAARNDDYILGDAVIELKILDDEGLSTVERQAKLAAQFPAIDPERQLGRAWGSARVCATGWITVVPDFLK